MNERDETIFTLALKDKFPEMAFISRHREMYGGNRACASIALSDSSEVDARIDRGWSPDFFLCIQRSSWFWGHRWGGGGRWAWDPPTLQRGTVFSNYMSDDVVTRRFIQTVWRMIGRVTTNKIKKGHPLGNDLMDGDRRLMADQKGGDTWCGHQALAWCREGGNRRMLDGTIRPCDDWEIPKDRWYQDLMRRAMDTEGWNAKTLPGTRKGGSDT